ncbi:MAG: DUF1810 domain-containing protein [Candidatus Acidiferrum sp.]
MMGQTDPYSLGRFLDAQNSCYQEVCKELRKGYKSSHWMWFIFPQWKGLGQSSIASRYAIASIHETKAFLAHPILGARLIECTQLVNDVEGRTVEQIFGYPDDLKFRSSMTLFANVETGNRIFLTALAKYFGGEPDPRTIELLQRNP